MTTHTWVTAVAHTSDATFREWGLELSTQLTSAGLVKHTDTGQINWATVTRPTLATAAGFEIWRFNDELQVTAPIFLKIEYGTSSLGVTSPQIWLTVGTGTNGTGTLTGAVSARETTALNPSLPAIGAFPSYLCVAPGFFGLLWKQGGLGGGGGIALMTVTRTHDSNGSPTETGYFVTWGATSYTSVSASQSVRTAAPVTVFSASTLCSIVPGQVISSLSGTNLQVYAHFGSHPLVWTIPTLATVILAEIPAGVTFQVAMVGSTSRTFLSLGAGFRPVTVGAGIGGLATYGFAMLWE